MKLAHWWGENRQRRSDVNVHGENMDSGTFIITTFKIFCFTLCFNLKSYLK